MAELKPYPKYKDSGVEWIGEIPEKWSLLPFKRIANLNMGQSPPSNSINDTNKGLPFLQGNADFTSIYPNPRVYSTKPLRVSKKKDILLSVRAPVGSLNKSNRAYVIGRGLCAITSKINADFLWYLLQYNRIELKMRLTGSTFEAVTLDDVKNLKCSLPTPKEQNKIGNFLNRKTTQIDSLISDKERLIELLEEKRQAVITETVTKGLDPDVKMKDSGIEWIGEIPEHWNLIKLKYMATERDALFQDGNWIESDVIKEHGIRYLTTGNIGSGTFKRQGSGYISENTFEELNCLKALPGDLAISRLNKPIARACILPDDHSYYVVAVDIVIFRPNRKFNSKFLEYLLNVPKFAEYAALKASGATMLRISRTNLENLKLPIPSIKEQHQIIDYISDRTGDIIDLINKLTCQIKKLKEYRESLIYEAVTGKIDLRDYKDS